MLFGAHLSVSGGYDATVEYAQHVGAECMQVFAKSPRQWHGKPIDPDAAARFAELRAESGFGPLFTHTAYLLNLASDDPVLWHRSVGALADEMTRGRLLQASGVVLHVGADRTDDPAAAADRVARGIREAFALCDCTHPETRLLLENTAGAGHTFGGSFEEMGWVLDLLGKERVLVGVCLDTCHAHAYGHDLATPLAWDALLAEIEQACGSGALGLIHANDCMFERGSHRDRHAWIGEGTLGEAAFDAMVCAPAAHSMCVVTEMPGEVPEKDVVNIERLKALRTRCDA
ncbi:MAG: deoxyribonuclease IV [Actinomycetota bacterium]|nr:deoxyribonuclease IV [Actinomycetota bacterium]